ncbi:MAG: phosphatase PAP2 family protein [Paracoccaceae bacterium]
MLNLPRLASPRAVVVLAILALALATVRPNPERYGDRLQVALPLLALGCSAVTGGAGEFALRYAGMFLTVHGLKGGLGQTAINERPNGGYRGMPSAHTSTAVLGASALVHDCLRGSPLAQGAVLVAAGFTGASRIGAGAHDIWQVLIGALIGWAWDRALRRPSRARDTVRSALVAIWRTAARTCANALSRAARGYSAFLRRIRN